MNHLSLLLVGAGFVALGAEVQAQGFPDYRSHNEWSPTAAEISQLPPYCQAQFQPQQTNARSATSYACGPNFNHFCPGLVALNRASNPLGTKKQRSQILGIAERTLKGVREKMVPSCALAADVRGAEQRVQLLRLHIK